MDSTSSSPSRLDKGKRRAEAPVSERTPLLATAAVPPASDEEEDISSESTLAERRRRFISRLIFIFSISLAVCVMLFIVLAVLAWSYAARASGVTPEQMMQHLVIRGPNTVNVLNVTSEGGMWVHVDGEIGVDAGGIIGVNSDPYGDGLAGTWKALGRWGISQLQSVSVSLSSVEIRSEYDGSILATVDLPPVEIPLSSNPPHDYSWLQEMSATVFIQPSSKSSDLVRFARDSWQGGSFAVIANVDSVEARGGSLNDNSWRRKFSKKLTNVETVVRTSIPVIPGLPTPGPGAPFPAISSLVTLQSFSVFSDTNALALKAQATVIDPAPQNINITTPPLTFGVSLPHPGYEPVPIATVSTEPFGLTHPNITLFLTGKVLPLPQEASALLSTFLARYLSAEPNPVIISTDYVPGLNVDMLFPAPNPKPHILRNVTIKNMRIKPYGTTFLASGSVHARVVLPKGMNIDVDVKHILPDVLVFDGEVPDDVTISKPPEAPLPDPLPRKAFGHIRPEDYLDAVSIKEPDEENEGAIFTVSANIVDVPLQVLPGRSKEFGDFVSKVIFESGGATAGLLGSTSVVVEIPGLPIHGPGGATAVEMSKLPFRGSVKIGKKGFFEDTLDWFERHLELTAVFN